jgi:citrate lyase beta subunit
MKTSGIFVRAKTIDSRWATVDVLDLTEESFKIFVLRKLNEAGIVAGLTEEVHIDLETTLTKAQADL